MIKSRSMIDLTPELEAEIKARTKIRPDAPGTKPGDPGNGHVLVLDDRTQKFNGRKYRKHGSDGYYVATKTVDGKAVRNALHLDVWAFHNDAKPADYVIHHDHRDENGQWDNGCNDIDHLLLMTKSEHRLYHAKHKPPFNACREECSSSGVETNLPEVSGVGHFKFVVRRFKKTIRCKLIDGAMWFVAQDVAELLGYKNSRKALADHVVDEDKRLVTRNEFPMNFKRGGTQTITVINESGLHSLICDSELPSAKAFKRWVMKIALPALRRYSYYIPTPNMFGDIGLLAPLLFLPENTTLEFVGADEEPFVISHSEDTYIQREIPVDLDELVERNQT